MELASNSPNLLVWLLALAGGFGLTVASHYFDKTAFAKAHGTITFFLGLALFAAAGYAAVVFSHDAMAWLLVLMGSVACSKLKEARDKRQRNAALRADFRSQVETALAARQGSESVEIDVSKASEEMLWTLINDSKKKGLSVETVKSHTSKEVKLRLSGAVNNSAA